MCKKFKIDTIRKIGTYHLLSGNSKVKDQLINLLDLMFKSSKNANEKITALHNDFGIDLTQEEEGDLEVMCNLGEGIYEDGLMKGKQEGWEKGRKEGRKEGRREGKLELALEMLKDGMALEKVASTANYHFPSSRNLLNKIN